MKFLATIALLATAVAAAPAEKLFQLKSAGASNSSHNDIYLSIGRGAVPDPLNSEAIFATRAPSHAASFYLANSTIYWNGPTTGAPYALDLINVPGKPYTIHHILCLHLILTITGVRKERAQISVKPTTGSKGFSITPEGVQGPSETWDGWLCKLFFHGMQDSS